jgi:hypothetical protein
LTIVTITHGKTTHHQTHTYQTLSNIFYHFEVVLSDLKHDGSSIRALQTSLYPRSKRCKIKDFKFEILFCLKFTHH